MSQNTSVMAALFAQRIILGKMTYAQVPRLLKDQVKMILIENAMGYLAKE